jgi:hypothetical protein
VAIGSRRKPDDGAEAIEQVIVGKQGQSIIGGLFTAQQAHALIPIY